MWDPEGYDRWYDTFQGAVDDYLDWELLKAHLPKDRSARILDAAGGTGRIALRLAEMGYSVSMCDISPEMLSYARKKLASAGLSDAVDVFECDLERLSFDDESFDFVVCWDGAFQFRKELIRVTRRTGRLSLFSDNKCYAFIDRFQDDPADALRLLTTTPSSAGDSDQNSRATTVEEARSLMEQDGVSVLGVYAVCGWASVLGFDDDICQSREWDQGLFDSTRQMALRLCREPGLSGTTRHLVIYAEKP